VREEGEGRRGRRGSAFIPGLKTGDFPLRPLHPRKLKAYRSDSGVLQYRIP